MRSKINNLKNKIKSDNMIYNFKNENNPKDFTGYLNPMKL